MTLAEREPVHCGYMVPDTLGVIIRMLCGVPVYDTIAYTLKRDGEVTCGGCLAKLERGGRYDREG